MNMLAQTPIIEITGGQKRFGSFVAIYGIPETRALIKEALAGKLAAA